MKITETTITRIAENMVAVCSNAFESTGIDVYAELAWAFADNIADVNERRSAKRFLISHMKDVDAIWG